MKTKICTIKLHSVVDLITNSSTELFCTVKGSSREDVQKLLSEILEDFGCETLLGDFGYGGMWVDESEENEGCYDIMYENHTPPCKAILKRIREVFEVIAEEEF